MADAYDADRTPSIVYSEAEIKYFIEQLEKTGRYEVSARQTSTPGPFQPGRNVSFGTPTPVREYRKSAAFAATPVTSVLCAPQPYRSSFYSSLGTFASPTTSAMTSVGSSSVGAAFPPLTTSAMTSAGSSYVGSAFAPLVTSTITSVGGTSWVPASNTIQATPWYTSQQGYMSTTPLYTTNQSTVTNTVPQSVPTRTSVQNPILPNTQAPYLQYGIPTPPPPPMKYSVVSLPDYSKSLAFQDKHGMGNRIPRLPEFSGEIGKETVEFEVWKYDVKCLVKESIYSHYAILEAIRRSLKGKARSVLLHLGELPQVSEILDELEGIYGNVASSEKVKEQFYSAQQAEGESLADYSMRLEQLLVKTDMHLTKTQRDEMLCGRLWSGLRSSELRNITRFKYESVKDFNTLRRQIRQVEEDLKASSVIRGHTARETVESTEQAAQHMTLVEHKLLQQLQELTGQLKSLNTRVESIEGDCQKKRPEREKGSSWQRSESAQASGGQNSFKGKRFDRENDQNPYRGKRFDREGEQNSYNGRRSDRESEQNPYNGRRSDRESDQNPYNGRRYDRGSSQNFYKGNKFDRDRDDRGFQRQGGSKNTSTDTQKDNGDLNTNGSSSKGSR